MQFSAPINAARFVLQLRCVAQDKSIWNSSLHGGVENVTVLFTAGPTVRDCL